MFTLQIKRKQLRVIEGLSDSVKGQIKDALMMLKADPVPVSDFDVKKLVDYESTYRIRIGGVRLVYSVDWEERIISIQYIGSRKKAYK